MILQSVMDHKMAGRVASLVGRSSLIVAAVLVGYASLLLIPGHLAINAHEVDVLHAVDMAMRMARGDIPHIDFMTPLGILSIAPVAAFIALGFPVYQAFLAANIAIALMILPAILRVMPRLGRAALPFALLCLILSLALVYGGVANAVSISVYYNRWCWAIASLILVMIFLPRAGDSIWIGVGLGLLALTKITFFAALCPVVALSIIYDRDWRRLAWVGAAGLAVALAATLWLGFGFWIEYLGDLRGVAGSEIRPNPGMDFLSVLAAPGSLPGTLLLLATVIVLRRTEHDRAGLLLLLCLPALAYITYQNWGNDPKWLAVLACLLLVWAGLVPDQRVLGEPARYTFLALAGMAGILILPSVVNMSVSPFRNLGAMLDDYKPMLKDVPDAPLMVEMRRSYDPRVETWLPALDDQLSPEDATPLVLGGVTLPRCRMLGGYYGHIYAIAEGLAVTGYSGQRIALADVINPLPLIGPFEPVATPPWYYGGGDGLAEADVVVLPRCPVSAAGLKPFVEAMEEIGAWQLVEETPLYWVFRGVEG